nr:MAG TPA: hypothetical protein [Caudoviricetes sp.]
MCSAKSRTSQVHSKTILRRYHRHGNSGGYFL